MENNSQLMDIRRRWHGTLKSYWAGFLLSILLTVVAYFIVTKHLFSSQIVIFAIMGLGIVQAVVQLFFFLHLGKESKPRWNLFIFLIMVSLLTIIVLASLWVMYNLDERMMH